LLHGNRFTLSHLDFKQNDVFQAKYPVSYSYRSESTGLAVAALIVWKLTVRKERINEMAAGSRNIHMGTDVLYAKFSSHFKEA